MNGVPFVCGGSTDSGVAQNSGGNREKTVMPMERKTQPLPLQLAERCGARTRSGGHCRSPKVEGRPRCRMHGGAPGSGAPKGKANGNYKHGKYCRDTLAALRLFKAIARIVRGSRVVGY